MPLEIPRLPEPGADEDEWGDILNQFLEVEHEADGTLKTNGTLGAYAPLVSPNLVTPTLADPTFTGTVTVPTPTIATHAATKGYVDSLDSNNVKLTGNQTVAGIKSFSSNILAPAIGGPGYDLGNLAGGLLALYKTPGDANSSVLAHANLGIRFGLGGSNDLDITLNRSSAKQLSINNSEGTLAANLAPSINAQTGTGYTLVLNDAGKQITRNNSSASTQTLPQNSAAAIPVGAQIRILNIGTGTVTIQAGTGATLVGDTSITTNKSALVTKIGTNGWMASLSGGSSAPLIDEDDMASNTDTQAPTQQSVKAYVDNTASQYVMRPGGVANMPTPTIIAHRGGAGPAPENTLEAMRVAAASGAHALEMDVQILGDGSIGLMHDETVNRTTDGTGATTDYTALTWQNLNAAHNSIWPRAVTPPLLSQVIAEFGGDQVLVIEPKNTASVPGICDILDRYSLSGQVVIQGTSNNTVSAIKSRGYLAYHYWGTEPAGATINSAISNGADFIGGDRGFSDTKIQQMVDTGKPVWMWTVNRRHQANELLALGVSGVMTNEPTYLAATAPVTKTDSWKQKVSGYGLNQWPTGQAYSISDAGELVLSGASGTQIMCIGEVSPAPAVRTIDIDCSFETLGSGSSAVLIMTAPDDKAYSSVAGQGSEIPDGWMAYLRESGLMTLYKHTGPSTATAVTPAGHISTGALAAEQWAHLKLEFTATQVTITRTDTSGTHTVTDSTFRGGYVFIGKKSAGSRTVKFKNLVIS